MENATPKGTRLDNRILDCFGLLLRTDGEERRRFAAEHAGLCDARDGHENGRQLFPNHQKEYELGLQNGKALKGLEEHTRPTWG